MKNFFIFFVLIFFSFKIQANDNEIEILIDIPGTGIKIDNHYKIKVHYSGSLLDGKEFDSSFKRNKPFEFQIGLRQVIPGWELGINGMKVGCIRMIKIQIRNDVFYCTQTETILKCGTIISLLIYH